MHLDLPVRRAVGLILSAAIVASLAAVGLASTARAATTPTFRVSYEYWCASLFGGVTQSAVLEQLDATGAVVESASGTTDPGGAFNHCFHETWHAGMKIRGSLDGGPARTLTLPKLSVRIDRATDVVSGVAPAGRTVKLSVQHWTTFSSTTAVQRTKTVSADGTYAKDFTTLVNIIGGDYVNLDYTTAGGDFISVTELTPLVEVWIGRANFGMQLLSGTSAKVTLRNSAGTFRGSGYAMYPGYDVPTLPDWVFQTKAGTPVTARVGDKVSSAAQSNMSFTIPSLTITANATTDHISGACPANRKLKWVVYTGSGSFSTAYVGAGVCSAAGAYDVDLSGNGGLAPGQPVEIVARMGTGDLVARKKLAQ